ncbi:MAG: NADH-quinone oxidoreductase subunit NuoK [Verrucomicrobiia bacterium]|jgi:NADH-quinone oxidoreductase subunit K
MTTLAHFQILASLLFAIGLFGAVTRRNAIIVLLSIEIMFNAANLSLVAFWRYSPHPEQLSGVMFAIFGIAISAAEAAVGLALVIVIYRYYKSIQVDEMRTLKG